MKAKKIFILALASFLLAGCSGEPQVGPQGPQGSEGAPGQDGKTVLQGSGVPGDELGNDGDMFIDTSTWDFYSKTNGHWTLVGNIKGPQGPEGPGGAPGQDGKSLLTGHGEPTSALGSDGDSYIDLDTWNYYLKNNGVWEKNGNISYTETDTVNFKIGGNIIASIEVKPNSRIELSSTSTLGKFDWIVEGTTDRKWNFDGYFADRVNGDVNLCADGEMKPELSLDGLTITYGLYPQAHLTDTEVISKLEKLSPATSKGWYLYNGDFYAKTVAAPYYSWYQFDDESIIEVGATYWFKCEPMVWNVLKTSGNERFVLSPTLLDVHAYDDDSNAYSDSEIRTWLNDDFYNSTFILGNDAIFANTKTNNDNISLLTQADYTNTEYGFENTLAESLSRKCLTTDWARARGAYAPYDPSHGHLNHGYYWTRNSSGDSRVWVVSYVGSIDTFGYSETGFSVRPCLSINIE